MEESETKAEQLIEHHLLIEFIFKNKKFLYKRHKFPIQNSPFIWGFRIKNISTLPFPGGTLSNSKIISPSGSTYVSNKTFALQALNPNEHVEVWFGEIILHMEGEIGLECSIDGKAADQNIKIFQILQNSGEIEKCDLGINRWVQVDYIQRQMELLQANTNLLILFLTGLIFYEAVFGIKKTLLFVLSLLGDLSLKCSNIVSNIQ